MRNKKKLLSISILLFILPLFLLTINHSASSAQAHTNLIPITLDGNIWVIDPDTLSMRKITMDANNDMIYVNPAISASGKYLVYEKRMAPFEYYMGATTYSIYDLHTNSLIVNSAFSTDYHFTDLYGEPKTEAHTILGWMSNTDTLLFVEEVNNCNQDPNQTRLLNIYKMDPPFNNPVLSATQTATSPAIEAVKLIPSQQNWIDFRYNCCGCGPDISHLKHINPDRNFLLYDPVGLNTTAIVPSFDNTKVAYASSSGYQSYYYESLTELGTSILYVADIGLNNPNPIFTLTNYHIDDSSVQWAASGQHVSFITFNINQDIYDYEQFVGVVTKDGYNPIILNTPSVKSTQWSPNGTKLLILTESGGVILYDVNTRITHHFQSFGSQVSLSTSSSCENIVPSRLLHNTQAKVSENPPLANNLRAQPNKDSQLIDQIPPGDSFTIVDGPICNDGYRYWYVKVDATWKYGWTAEAYLNEYYVEPIP